MHLSQIGFIIGIYSLINISQIIWAQLSLKFQRNRLFIFLGSLFYGLLFLPMILIKTGQIGLYFVLRLIQGIFQASTIPSQSSLMADHISIKNRAKRVSKFTQFNLLGSLFGTIIGGGIFTLLTTILFFSETNSFNFLFLITGSFAIIGSFIFIKSVPDRKNFENGFEPETFITRNIHFSESKMTKKNKIIAYTKKFRNFWKLCLFAGLFYFGNFLASPFFIILETQIYTFSLFQAALLTSVTTILQVFVAYIQTKINIIDKLGKKILLCIGIIIISLTSIGVVIPYYFSNIDYYIWSIFVWILMGIGWGIFNVTITIFILDIAHPKYRASLIAIYNTIMGIMMFLGAVFGGIIIEFFGEIPYVFLLRSIILLAALVFLRKIEEPIISAIDLSPLRFVFTRSLRMTASRGIEPILVYVRSRRNKKKHIISKRKMN